MKEKTCRFLENICKAYLIFCIAFLSYPLFVNAGTEPVIMDINTSNPYLKKIAENHMTAVPYEIQEMLNESGWTITVENKRLTTENVGIAAGLAYLNENRISLSGTPEDIKRALVHEIGHAVATELNNIDLSSEFVQIFEEEKDKFITKNSIGHGHETSSSREYFAECFREYFYDRKNLKARCPKTERFIHAFIMSIKNQAP